MKNAESAEEQAESLEGHVVDIACVRKYPRAELAERAREHTRECVLMGHCIESGYALVGDDGAVTLLDHEATPRVVQAVTGTDRARGIRLRVQRIFHEGEMHTSSVEEVGS